MPKTKGTICLEECNNDVFKATVVVVPARPFMNRQLFSPVKRYTSREKSWDTLHFLHLAMNCHPPSPQTRLVMGELHAMMGQFHVHANFKCPIDDLALFYGEGKCVYLATMSRCRTIWFSISFL